MAYNTSLAVMRAQPFHLGHKRLIDSMLENSEKVVVVLGSIQEFGTKRNPFSYEFRKQCIELTYIQEIKLGKLNLMGLKDVDESIEWSSYVLDSVKEEFNLSPDSYFFGDEGNGKYFENSGLKLECQSREVVDLISGTQIRKMLEFNLDESIDEYIPQSTKEMLRKLKS